MSNEVATEMQWNEIRLLFYIVNLGEVSHAKARKIYCRNSCYPVKFRLFWSHVSSSHCEVDNRLQTVNTSLLCSRWRTHNEFRLTAVLQVINRIR